MWVRMSWPRSSRVAEELGVEVARRAQLGRRGLWPRGTVWESRTLLRAPILRHLHLQTPDPQAKLMLAGIKPVALLSPLRITLLRRLPPSPRTTRSIRFHSWIRPKV